MQIDSFLTRWHKAGGSERTAKTSAGRIRWLRTKFQRPSVAVDQQKQAKMDFSQNPPSTATTTPKPAEKRPWTVALPEQVAAIAQALAESPLPLDESAIAERFTGKGPWKKHLLQLLETLVALGRARMNEDGRYGASK